MTKEEDDVRMVPLNEIPKEDMDSMMEFVDKAAYEIKRHLRYNPLQPTAKKNGDISIRPQLTRLALEAFTIGALSQYEHGIMRKRENTNRKDNR